MAEAADAVAGYVGRGRPAFDRDPAIRDAILYQIIVLGEAANSALAADPSLEGSYPAIDWSPVARMRDRVAHRYWATDREIVWATASDPVPAPTCGRHGSRYSRLTVARTRTRWRPNAKLLLRAIS
jgi:uncharacterized protein with HEPN domain